MSPSVAQATEKTFRYPPRIEGPGDEVLTEILREIMVAPPHLAEAKYRRECIRRLVMRPPAARAFWFSGSIAHGTHNSPLGDADCGVMIDRRALEFRAFGPDAGEAGRGPEGLIRELAAFIRPLLADAGYPDARLDLSGNRAIRIEFNSPVDFDDLGEVDPSVDLIVGLERRNGPGVWIPNRRRNWWDPAHPHAHTRLMTTGALSDLIVHRAHVVRLEKRAVKRDGLQQGTPAMCSWNLSALALEHVAERLALASGLAESLRLASSSIRLGLTDDPAGVAGPIGLPDGMTQAEASDRLRDMAGVVGAAASASSVLEARRLLSPLFGVEIDNIRARERNDVRRHPLNDALRRRDLLAVSGNLGAAQLVKPTRSDGAR